MKLAHNSVLDNER